MKIEEVVDYGLFINTQMLDLIYADGIVTMMQSAGLLSDISGWLCELKEIAEARRRESVLRRSREQRARDEFAFRLKINLTDSRKRGRLAWLTHSPIKRRQLKQLGELFRQALSEGAVATYSLVVALNTLGNLGFSDSAETLYDKLDNSDVERCNDCKRYFDVADSSHNIDEEVICDSCRDEHYHYSDEQDALIHKGSAVPLYRSIRAYRNGDPDDYVTRRYGNRADDLYAYDDAFVDEDTYDALHYEDGSDDDDDYSSSSNLADYHQSSRNFVEINETPKIPALGVELEVYCEDRYDTVETLKGSFGSKLILERDSSLDDDYGFEIVTQPYGVTEWKVFASDMLSVLRDNDCVAYNHPAGHGYGIHVNVHRRHLSPLAEARIMMLLCDVKNVDFVRAIAQRTCVYSAYVDMGSLENPKVRAINANSQYLNSMYRTTQSNITGRTNERHCRKIYGAGKYAPVNWRDNIAEFRLFQSTLHTQSFMKNLEFVWALIAWTKPEAATGSSTDHRDFIRWLDTPQHRADYPNLVAYLSRRRFWAIGLDGTRSFNSTWLDLIAYPNTLTETEERLAA